MQVRTNQQHAVGDLSSSSPSTKTLVGSDRVLRSRRGFISISKRLQGFVGRPPKRLFTADIKRQLKQWLVRRRRYPYPTREEKRRLAIDTGLEYNQICNWFANWRRKLKNAAASEHQQLEESSQKNCYGINKSSWGRRILRYNRVAARNAEKIPVSDEDELQTDEENLDDDTESPISYNSDNNEISDKDEPEVSATSELQRTTEHQSSESAEERQAAAMRADHCYTLQIQQPDSNGNYQHSKWLTSVQNFVPSTRLRLVPAAASCCWTSVSRAPRVSTSTRTCSSSTRHAQDEIVAAEALTALARRA